jgi:hypothetical protein
MQIRSSPSARTEDRGNQIDLICLPKLTSAEGRLAEQNGGYARDLPSAGRLRSAIRASTL